VRKKKKTDEAEARGGAKAAGARKKWRPGPKRRRLRGTGKQSGGRGQREGLGPDKAELSKFTNFFGETKLPDSVESGVEETKWEARFRDETGVAWRAETDGEETQALDWREEIQALDSNGARPSIALPLGGGCPGVAPQVPSGLSPPARVRSCCPATTAPGGEGVVALVRALECNSVREGREGCT
jgi:hypothetical protein